MLEKIGFSEIKIFDLTDRIYPNFVVFYPESTEMCKLVEQGKIGYILVKARALNRTNLIQKNESGTILIVF